MNLENLGLFYKEEPLSGYTTFKIGGPAEYLLIPQNETALIEALDQAKAYGVAVTILGNGSNVLVDDTGVKGLVIVLKNTLNVLTVRGETLYAGAGATMQEAALAAYRAGLSGLEFAHGIPGTVGGGVIMNAGAYGGELTDVVASVRLLDKTNQPLVVDHDAMAFRYRGSRAMDEGLIVTGCTFKLHPADKAGIRSTMDELMDRRRAKQPLELPSSGSTFKRPPGHFAGKLITDCGLKGLRYGGAMISDKHAGFVVNVDSATAEDVKQLIATVQKVIKEEYNVSIEREVKYIGGR
ncbi:UDP-N-acetylmuramate dehydrogenase [Peptoniphilus equinus]|uniref:UDP-N-acetylenolpyruvoylglucosamine reductase n=1 Tax=Peptoniphilus equinus TaxID=3016343 RepID=A0ABY7QUM8_9FIRM|nr:UDP-N-acetylmuramate dehydrogenase [Peptoniphilus equinus]WBW50427.1 UDP-N-acetylmuramate dehydrogenase [Peptoniphilus equinus]